MALNFYVTSISGVFSVSRDFDGIEMESLNLGGDDPGGILTASDVAMQLRSSKRSPHLLQVFVEQTPHKVVIKGYRPNVQGVNKNFVNITLTQARVSAYQMGAVSQGRLRDTVRLTFITLDYHYIDGGTDYLWQLA